MVGREGNGGGHSRRSDGTGRKVSRKQNEKRNLLCMENISDSGEIYNLFTKIDKKCNKTTHACGGLPMHTSATCEVRGRLAYEITLLRRKPYAAAIAVVPTSFDLASKSVPGLFSPSRKNTGVQKTVKQCDDRIATKRHPHGLNASHTVRRPTAREKMKSQAQAVVAKKSFSARACAPFSPKSAPTLELRQDHHFPCWKTRIPCTKRLRVDCPIRRAERLPSRHSGWRDHRREPAKSLPNRVSASRL